MSFLSSSFLSEGAEIPILQDAEDAEYEENSSSIDVLKITLSFDDPD